MKDGIIRRKREYVLWLLVAVICFWAGASRAEGLRARYLENSATASVLELTVEKPPPTSIIVKQYIPPGTKLGSVSPPYSKFAAGKGEVKWLLRHPRPGVQTIVMNYSSSPGAGRATAVIRCKSPLSGKLMTIQVQ